MNEEVECDEENPEIVAKFKRTEYYILYKRRFLVLLFLSMALFINGEAWMTFGSVTKQSVKFFGTYNQQIILFSTLFLISYSIAAVPCMIMPQLIGARSTFLLGCFFNLLGCILRLIVIILPTESKFSLSTALFGNCCFGFSMSFLFTLPTLISSIWFGENERSLSTSVPLMANCVGVGFGYIDIFLAMDHSLDKIHIKKSFLYIFIFEFIFSFVCLIGCFIFVENLPPNPPSYSEKERIKNMRGGSFGSIASSTFRLVVTSFTKKGSASSIIAYMFNYAVYMIMFTYLAEIVDNYVSNQNSVTGYIGAFGVILGGCNTLFAGFLMERTKNNYNHIIAMLSNIIPAIPLMILLILCANHKLNNTSAIILLIWFLSFCPTFMSIGAEILAEITYPIDPNISSSQALILGNTFGAIMSSLLSLIKNELKFLIILSFSIFLYIASTIIMDRKFIRNRSIQS